jgi:2,3-bisphosphoglycerate-independent phosphoglycerate mutase
MLLADAADMQLQCAPPHDIIDQHVLEHAPRGKGAERIVRISKLAHDLLGDHAVNRERRAQGRPPVTDIWLWGQGRPVRFEPFAERFGPHSAIITGVDILRGFAKLLGMRIIEVPGATGYIDTNYAGKGEAAVRAIDELDMIVVHVEAADESAHMGSPSEKVKALERIDEMVVGPLLRKLQAGGDWRMLVAADHPTLCTTRGHSDIPPLFAFAGTGIAAVEDVPFTEAATDRGGYWIREGHRLMETFLRG